MTRGVPTPGHKPTARSALTPDAIPGRCCLPTSFTYAQDRSMMSTPKAKFSWPMLILAAITLTLSSYGLYELAHTFGDIPTPFAILVVGGFDLFAVAAGNHAMTIARDGDSAGPWNLAVVGAAILSATLQYAHTQLAGQPWAVGVMMAMFPLATVMLFEGTLRRAHRLNGRRTGQVAQPRAAFELLQWLVYPRQTWTAFRLGVGDRSLSADAAFKLGMVARAMYAEHSETVVPPRREITIGYDKLIPGYPELVAGDSGATSSDSGSETGSAPDRRSVRALVEENMQVSGADEDSVMAAVMAVKPGANPETIRREIRKFRTLRSA